MWWATVLSSKGHGVGKGLFFLYRSKSSSLVSGKTCIQISLRVVFKHLPLVWIWMQASSHPHPMTWGNSPTPLFMQGCLILMASLNLVVSQHPPGFPLCVWSPIGTSTTTCAYCIPIKTIPNMLSFLEKLDYVWKGDLLPNGEGQNIKMLRQ